MREKRRRISNSCLQVSGCAIVQCLNFERGADSAEMISGRPAVSAPPRKRTQDTEVDSRCSKLQISCVRLFVPCKSMISGQLYQHHPGKHPNYFGREQKLWYPHIRKPLGHLACFVFFCLGMEPNGPERPIFRQK